MKDAVSRMGNTVANEYKSENHECQNGLVLSFPKTVFHFRRDKTTTVEKQLELDIYGEQKEEELKAN